jgi:hypothetical protein
MDTTRPISQVEVEQELVRLSERLERETVNYAQVCERVAVTESEWKSAMWKAMVRIAAEDGGPRRSNAETREARAAVEAGPDLFRLYRISQESQRATAAALASIRAKMSAMQTLASNQRALVS